MATTTNLEKLVINYLTQEQYDDAREAGTLNANELYLTPDTGSTGGTVTSIATGGGLTGGPITSSGTISHDDTSSQSSVSNSGRTYIQSVTLDTYGHVTGLSSATETVTNSDEKVKVTNYTTSNSVYPIFYTGSNTPATTTQNVNVTDFVYVLDTNDRTLRIGSTSKTGKLQLGQSAGYTATITPTTLTASQTYTLPNKTGTVALTSDIPDVSGKIDTAGTGLSKSGTTLNHSNSVTAQTTQAVYPIKIDAQGHISAYGNAVTIPTKTSDLNNDSGYLTSSTVPTEIFIATYNTTTYADILAAYNAGKAIFCQSSGNIAPLENYSSQTFNFYHSPLGMGRRMSVNSSSVWNSGTLSYVTTNRTINGKALSSDITLTASDVSALPSSTVIPSKTSDLTNDSGFITSYTDENMKWTASTSSNAYFPLQSTSTAATGTANTLNSVSFYQYYNTAGGYRRLTLGNSTAYTTAGGAYGLIRLYGAAETYYGDLVPGVLSTSATGRLTANRTWTFPDATGTIALTSDIPTVPTNIVNTITTTAGTHTVISNATGGVSFNVPTKTSHLTNDSGFITSYTDEKLKTIALTSGTTYYPILATGANAAANRQVDSTLGGLKYVSTAGTKSAVGSATLQLGNATTSGTANNENGVLKLYGSTQYPTSLVSGAPTAERTITLPDDTGTLGVIWSITGEHDLDYSNTSVYKKVPTVDNLAWWNGAYMGTSSNLKYCAANNGANAQLTHVMYGSNTPSGTPPQGTVYFQTGSSAYTFQPRVNLTGLTASTTLSNWTSFTLSKGLYLITFQVNFGSASTYILRVDLMAGSNTITQVRSPSANSQNLIMNGAGLVECTGSTTIYFKAQTNSSSVSGAELHYSYVKLF